MVTKHALGSLIGSGRSASFLFSGKVSKFHFPVYCICNLGQLLMTFEISQGNSWWKKGYFVFKDRSISISRQTSLSKTWVNLSILATQCLMLSPPQRPKTLKHAYMPNEMGSEGFWSRNFYLNHIEFRNSLTCCANQCKN